MKNDSISRGWRRSIFTVVIIMLLIFSMLCIYLLCTLSSKMMQTTKDIALYTRNTVDNRLLEIRDNVTTFAINPVTASLKLQKEAASLPLSSIYGFCSKLNEFRITHSLVEDILIYYPNTSLVTGSLGYYTESQYDKLMYIRKKKLESGTPCWLLSHGQADFVLEDNRLFYLYDLTYASQPAGVIVVELNIGEVLNTPQESSGDSFHNLSWLGLIAGDDSICVENNSYKSLDETALATLRKNESAKINGILFCPYPSAFFHLLYFTGFNERNLFRTLYLAILFCGIGLIACISFGIFSSIRISVRNARPIHELATKLSDVADPAISSADLYAHITYGIDSLLDERSINLEKINSQQAIINDLFFNRLLTGNMSSEYLIFRDATMHNIIFEYPLFQVAVLCPDTMPVDTSRTALLSCYDSLEAEFMVGIVEDHFVLLFNTEVPLSADALAEHIESICARLCPGQIPAHGIGSCYDRLTGICTSYREALSEIRPEEKNSDAISQPLPNLNELSEAGSLPERAKEFILENLTDPMLGLYLIADHLSVSNTWLSSSFKKQYGIGIVQYINYLRIEKACELILTTDYKIKDIAEMTGFGSAISFIRVFKQYKKCTPASLRKN